jgi:serine/threonine-protein kinase
LAKLSTPALSEETQTLNAAPMTIEGSILGTVSYMSPEQAQGRRVDARSDIFSLGVLLYEMVTGQKAFSADSTISTIACILRDEVKPISDLANGVPAELEEVIGRALRKDPSDRWQTMDELFLVLAALKQKFDSGILTHTQILAHPVSVENQAAQKNRMLVTMVAAIAAAVAVSGGGGWWWAARKSARLEAAKQKAAAAAAAAAVVPAPAGALPATPAEPPAPVTPTAPASTALTNDDVLSMVKEKLSASLIIGQIRASETKFDLSTPEVIRLAKEGVPERVIEAMRNPKAVPPERSASASARNPAPQAPVVPPSAAPVTLPPPVAPPVSVVAPPPVAAPPAPVSSGGTVVATRPVSALVLGGLPIAITLMANVPAGAEPGTALRFQVAQDLRVNGTIVVAQGAQVAGEVLGAGKKVLGIGGKMQFKLISVGAVDGQRLRIRASPGRNTEKNEHSIEAPGNRNKELLAPVGTQYMAYVDGDQIVAVKK